MVLESDKEIRKVVNYLLKKSSIDLVHPEYTKDDVWTSDEGADLDEVAEEMNQPYYELSVMGFKTHLDSMVSFHPYYYLNNNFIDKVLLDKLCVKEYQAKRIQHVYFTVISYIYLTHIQKKDRLTRRRMLPYGAKYTRYFCDDPTILSKN